MKHAPRLDVGSARRFPALTLLCLSLAAVSNVLALEDVDTTHTWAGAFVVLHLDGVLRLDCSGTLVAPDVFLTAGHCAASLKNRRDYGGIADVFVTFDTEFTQTPSLVRVADFVIHPGFPYPGKVKMDYINDMAVALLETPVLDRPVARLPSENMLNELRPSPGTLILSVGYGWDSNDRHGKQSPHRTIVYAGVRASGHLSYRALTPGFIMVTALSNQGDDNACFGDSGGPNFLIVDGEERLVGITSLGNSYSCEEVEWSVRVDTQSARDFLGQFLDLP